MSKTYEYYGFLATACEWIRPESGHKRAIAGYIQNTDDFLFALALTVMIFGAVISIALAARMEAFI